MTITTTREIALPADQPRRLFAGGVWRDAASGRVFPVHDPASGEVLAEVADSTPEDGAVALDAAVEAQHGWARTPPRIRAELLRAAFDEVTARAEDFAAVITLEMGKPLAEAHGEVRYGAEFLRWFGEEAVRTSGRYQSSPGGGSRQLVLRRPVGPALFITPWNFPLAMATRKIAPALAAGCTIVLKPSDATPLTALLLARVFEEVGLPPGVVNVVPTRSAHALTGPLIRDARLRKLSFTGSTAVGRALLAEASQNVLRTSMELGGNAPFLVFTDADLGAAVEGARLAKLRNMGQACTAANRFVVAEEIAEEFAGLLAARFADLTVAPGNEPGAEIGPLISDTALQNVDRLVRRAIDEGGRVLSGGRRLDGAGHFYPPTVLADVPATAHILSQEIFGPVAPITTFRTEEEAVRIANASEVGLAGYVYTRDSDRIVRLLEQLEIGMIGINQGLLSDVAAPFGGVKQSGLGREGGREGIEEYLETVYAALPDPFA